MRRGKLDLKETAPELDYYGDTRCCGSCNAFQYSTTKDIGRCTMHGPEIESFLVGHGGRSVSRLCPLWVKRLPKQSDKPQEIKWDSKKPCLICGYLGGVCCFACTRIMKRAMNRGLTQDEALEYAKAKRKMRKKNVSS